MDRFMNRVRAYLLALPHHQKRLIQVVADLFLVWTAMWMAFAVCLDFDEMVSPINRHLWLFLVASVVAIPLFVRFGMYRAVMRYFGSDALVAIIKAVSLSSLILGLWFTGTATMRI